MIRIWVDEWLDEWPAGRALVNRVTREGTPGKCHTGGEYYFGEEYHIFPKDALVVLHYWTSAEFAFCPGCGSFTSNADGQEHKEMCRMSTFPLPAWASDHSAGIIRCRCMAQHTIAGIDAAGWRCPDCGANSFTALW